MAVSILCVLALSIANSLLAQIAVPKLEGRVNDLAGLLAPSSRIELERKLGDYERRTGHQFALLTVASLEGEPIEDFSIRVVESWQLGRSDADDGLLLAISQGDRKMRIEVGYGLEGSITDALSARVIRQVLVPAFRSGRFDAGVDEAMDLLMRAGAGESVALPARGASGRTRQIPSWLFYLAVGAFILLARLMNGPGGGAGLRRRGGLGYYGGGPFGGGFGGGGGGGFGGGGGGFGGGGSSGSW